MCPATTVGMSHGSSKPTRSTPIARKRGRFKASAVIRPSRNCEPAPTVTHTIVLRTAVQKTESVERSAYWARPMKLGTGARSRL